MDRWNGRVCCVFSEKSCEGLRSWISQATVFSSMLQIQALPFTGNNNLIYGNSCKKRNHFQLSPMLMLVYILLTFILRVSQLWMIHMCLAVHQDSRGFCLLHLALPSLFCQSEGAGLGSPRFSRCLLAAPGFAQLLPIRRCMAWFWFKLCRLVLSCIPQR